MNIFFFILVVVKSYHIYYIDARLSTKIKEYKNLDFSSKKWIFEFLPNKYINPINIKMS